MKQKTHLKPDRMHLAAFALMILLPPLMYLAAERSYTLALPPLLGLFILANLLELAIR